MSTFDSNFDHELNTTVIEMCQKIRGCFECGKGCLDPGLAQKASLAPRPVGFPTRLCSRCRVARYCGEECQKLNWKPEHKDACDTYLQNREDGIFTTLESLYGSDWLTDESLVILMRKRQEMFFRAIQRYGMSSGFPIELEMTVSAIGSTRGGTISLIMLACFNEHTPSNGLKKRYVPRVLFEIIDKGPTAIENINIGRGILSSAALGEAMKHLQAFVKKCSNPKSHCQISFIQLGRGLAPKLEEIEAELEGTIVYCDEAYIPSPGEMAMNMFAQAFLFGGK